MEPSAKTTYLILCATHRTGSNLLEQYLKASKVAGRPREYYSPRLGEGFAQELGVPNPNVDFLGYHQGILACRQTENGVFAAKIMFRHLENIHNRLAASGKAAQLVKSTPWETVATLLPSPLLIHVSRKDKVKQAISMVRAKQSGVYSTVHLDKGVKQQKVVGEYDYHLLRYHVEKFEREDAAWEALFKTHGLSVHKIVFEDFIKDPEGQTAALLQALNFPKPEKWTWPEILIRSQSDSINAEWHARYLQDDKRGDQLRDERREKRHRARKALEKRAARQTRWASWEGNPVGRGLVALERWWVRGEPVVTQEMARGDGVDRSEDD